MSTSSLTCSLISFLSWRYAVVPNLKPLITQETKIIYVLEDNLLQENNNQIDIQKMLMNTIS